MHLSRRAGLAGIAALALLATPVLAQTAPGTAGSIEAGGSKGSADTPANSGQEDAAKPATAPDPQTAPDPAATETPSQPAASGGDASDATPSGQPSGSTVTAPTSDSSSPMKGGSSQLPEPGNSGASPAQPRNAVGDKFELPQVSKGNQVEMISGLCGVQMKGMTPAACTCLAQKALTALSDPQRDYLIASVVAPPVSDRMLKDGRVGVEDQKTLFAFLNTTSTECAASTASAAPSGGKSSDSPASGAAKTQTPGSDGDGGGMSRKDGSEPKMDTPPTAEPKPSN